LLICRLLAVLLSTFVSISLSHPSFTLLCFLLHSDLHIEFFFVIYKYYIHSIMLGAPFLWLPLLLYYRYCVRSQILPSLRFDLSRSLLEHLGSVPGPFVSFHLTLRSFLSLICFACCSCCSSTCRCISHLLISVSYSWSFSLDLVLLFVP
jgi:hypothetical protein